MTLAAQINERDPHNRSTCFAVSRDQVALSLAGTLLTCLEVILLYPSSACKSNTPNNEHKRSRKAAMSPTSTAHAYVPDMFIQVHLYISRVSRLGNGEIDFEEFSGLLSKCMQMSDDEYKERVAEAFRIMDMDQNGFIEPQELKQVMERFGQRLSDADVARIMDEVDTNGDDRVSFTEFQELMMQNRTQLGF